MSFKAAIISVALALFAGNAIAGFTVGNDPMTHDQAVAYCAKQGSRLADVTQGNRNDLISVLGGKPGWIGSWDSNYYTGSCTYSINNHIGASDCNNMLYPVCNGGAILNHASSSSSHCESQSSSHLHKSFNAGAQQEACGPRRSRSSRSSRCSSPSSSSSYCSDSSVGCNVPFQYVYLTNTITASWTSTQLVTTTTTSTDVITFATVAAYTVTGDAN